MLVITIPKIAPPRSASVGRSSESLRTHDPPKNQGRQPSSTLSCIGVEFVVTIGCCVGNDIDVGAGVGAGGVVGSGAGPVVGVGVGAGVSAIKNSSDSDSRMLVLSRR